MPKAKLQPEAKLLSGATRSALQEESEPKYVKIVVFDDRNHVLTIKSKNRFIMPGGRVEWDDDDAEAAARREVFETANIALGLVIPVTVIKTNARQSKSARTIVFVGRMRGEEPSSGDQYRFMSKETFLDTVGGQCDLFCALINAAYRVLISEEIRNEHAETAQTGREKYNSQSLL